MIFALPPGETDAFPTLDDVYRKGIAMARTTFIQNGMLPPTFLAVKPDGQAVLYVIEWTADHDENKVCAVLKDLFRKDEIVRFSYFEEAVVFSGPMPNEGGYRKQTCIQVVAADHYGNNRGCAIITKRTDNQIFLGEVRQYEDNMASSRFTTILDQTPQVLN